jgi:recombination protein RecA
MTPKAEIDGEVDQQFMGLHARLMSRFMRRVASLVNENGVMLVLINQVRKNIAQYGAPDESTGGKAIKFYSSLRIEVRTSGSKKLTVDGETVGHTVTATIKKNRLGAPHTSGEFDIIYGRGIDGTGSLLDVAEKIGVLVRSGAYYTEVATGERISEVDGDGKSRAVVGKEAVKALLRRDDDLRVRIEEAVQDSLSASVSRNVTADADDDIEDVTDTE